MYKKGLAPMPSFYPRWKEEGSTWKQILDVAQSVAEPLARDWQARVTRDLWDAPKIDLRWNAGDAERSIQVLIQGKPGGYELRINGAVWRDEEKAHVRKWWASDDVIPPVPVPSELADNLSDRTFRDDLREALKKARKIVFAKHQKHLERETALPERNASLTIKAGQAKEKRRSRRGFS